MVPEVLTCLFKAKTEEKCDLFQKVMLCEVSIHNLAHYKLFSIFIRDYFVTFGVQLNAGPDSDHCFVNLCCFFENTGRLTGSSKVSILSRLLCHNIVLQIYVVKHILCIW